MIRYEKTDHTVSINEYPGIADDGTPSPVTKILTISTKMSLKASFKIRFMIKPDKNPRNNKIIAITMNVMKKNIQI